MKHPAHILSLLTLLLTLSYNVSASVSLSTIAAFTASTTVQTQDVIIIDKVEHKLNINLLHTLDSVTYNALKSELDFNASSHSGNWRGHIATFEIKDNKLYLKSVQTSSTHTDFNGPLDNYKDRKGRILASWISGTLICGTGECLHIEPDRLFCVYEKETEIVVENGIIVSSRTYNNKIRNAHGTVHFDNVRYLLPKEFQYDNFPELKGRVTVQIQAAEFNDEGKITDWSVRIYSGGENLTDAQKERVIAEVKRVLKLYDFQTFMRDGSWYWRTTRNTPINWPLIFK